MSNSNQRSGVQTVAVSQKGQATIPKEIRERVGIKPGGDVLVYEEDGRVIVEPFPSTPEELHGIHTREDAEPGSVLAQSREWDAEDRAREEAKAQRLFDRLEARRAGSDGDAAGDEDAASDANGDTDDT